MGRWVGPRDGRCVNGWVSGWMPGWPRGWVGGCVGGWAGSPAIHPPTHSPTHSPTHQRERVALSRGREKGRNRCYRIQPNAQESKRAAQSRPPESKDRPTQRARQIRNWEWGAHWTCAWVSGWAEGWGDMCVSSALKRHESMVARNLADVLKLSEILEVFRVACKF